VPDDDPGVRQQSPQLLGLGLDRLDPVVDVEGLAAPVELPQDRVANEARRRLGDAGLDRQTVLGRRFDDGQVADAGQGQIESAATPERRLATCQPESAVALIAAPPVENSAAAAKIRSRASSGVGSGGRSTAGIGRRYQSWGRRPAPGLGGPVDQDRTQRAA
jgi:hypothetical protein